MLKLASRKREALEDSIYITEYAFCILFFVMLFVVLAVASFDPSDASPFTFAIQSGTNASELTNIFGPWGAAIADWSFQLFGLGALVFSFVFLVQVLATFKRPREKGRFLLRCFGYPQLLVSYLGLMCAFKDTVNFRGAEFFTGGIVGHWVFEFFASGLGRTGTIVALMFGVLASLPLCLGIRPIHSLTRLLTYIPLKRTKQMASNIEKMLPEKEEATLFDEVRIPRALYKVEQAKEIEKVTVENFGQSKTSIIPRTELETRPLSASDFASLVELLDYHESPEKDNLELEQARLTQEAALLEEKLSTFGVTGRVVKSQPGPVVNVHEFEPAPGVKVTKVLSLQDDLALGLRAQSILMAPQPGKSTIGVEIPAQKREIVSLRELLESTAFQKNHSPLPMALGKLVDGSPLISDLSSMPHLLVAGSTGSGKSVGINSILLSLMMSRTPKQLRLILVDPKMLELSNYDGIGHLLLPVVTDPSKAAAALKWAIDEMERRYKLMKTLQVRNVAGYNSFIEQNGGEKYIGADEVEHEVLPYIVIVIDELCDLMMTAPKDVEDYVQRLAQKARAAGIHLILATQRPSVDVLTGVIKANLPCRISFQVASKHDSRTIIETMGAERLLGKGDMLFLPPGTSKLVRAHGAYMNDKEINAVADALRQFYPVQHESKVMDEVERTSQALSQRSEDKNSSNDEVESNLLDEEALYERAVDFAISSGTVSTSSVQRNFRIGYNRAARIIDRMAKENLVGPSDVAGKPRQVLVSG